MSEEPDGKRLQALEKRLAAARKAGEPEPAGGTQQSFGQAQTAWRMIVELVVGIGMGVGLGFGLDKILGTQPWMLIVFTLFGFGAGVNVMMGTARELARAAEENEDEEGAQASDE